MSTLATIAVVLTVVLTSCGSSAVTGPGGALGGPARHGAVPSISTKTVPPTTTSTLPPTTTTTTTEQPGWTVVSTEKIGVAIDERTVTEPNGGLVTVIRFRSGFVRFGLHVGSQDPPVGSATIPSDGRSSIGPDEAPVLLAAFNGGFKMASGAGGFELDGQILSPLLPGMASLVIDTDGSARIGVWGLGLPLPGEQVASVRQNLAPLVTGGVTSPSVGDPASWGSMLGPGPAVPRSGLGQDTQGDILYAAGMSLVPADLATALVEAGAVNAMELDINPEWVQADAAPTAGTPLSALIPGQNRPADQYELGWTRDFITVLATH
jgi:hypothetical protein